MYLVRTKHSDKETITYNGVSYSTALSEGNNIFVGVTETKSWDGGSQNIIVYKITDLAISNTIRMRIVDEIPKDTVTSLTKDVWYFVEPNNIANPTGSVNPFFIATLDRLK